jgi:hypothetical protein
MRQKAETWQTYRGTTQTTGINPKPRKFCPGGPILGTNLLLYRCAKKLTHFYMKYKAETWQTCRGTAQTTGKNPKHGGPKWEKKPSFIF